MTNSICISILGPVLAVILLDGKAYADTFEFLTYTPPRGWTKQALRDGTAYQRPSGIGLITLYPSQPATGSAGDEFVKMWRAQVEPAVPGPAPQPQIHGDGDYTLAIGERQINVQGANTSVVLTVIVGRGRAIGVLTTGAGDEVLRELADFFSSLTVTRGAPGAPTASGSGPVSAGGIEVDFDPPPGYVARQNGRMAGWLRQRSTRRRLAHTASVRPGLRAAIWRRTRGQPSSKRCPVGASRAIATTRCGALRAPAGPTSGSAPMFKDSSGEATNTPRP